MVFGGSADALGLPNERVAPATVYGDAPQTAIEGSSDDVQYVDTPTQEAALQLIASIIEDGAMSSDIQGLARLLASKCPARNDWCELTALYNGVKTGRADLKPYGLSNGMRYMADARTGPDGGETDVFFKPAYILSMLRKGENGFDCDDATIFVGALAKDCGFRVGARAYGEGKVHGYEHVYPIALIPKRGPWATDDQGRIDESHIVGLDITVPYARVGWQPPRGDVFTAMLD